MSEAKFVHELNMLIPFRLQLINFNFFSSFFIIFFLSKYILVYNMLHPFTPLLKWSPSSPIHHHIKTIPPYLNLP